MDNDGGKPVLAFRDTAINDKKQAFRLFKPPLSNDERRKQRQQAILISSTLPSPNITISRGFFYINELVTLLRGRH